MGMYVLFHSSTNYKRVWATRALIQFGNKVGQRSIGVRANGHVGRARIVSCTCESRGGAVVATHSSQRRGGSAALFHDYWCGFHVRNSEVARYKNVWSHTSVVEP